MRSALRWLFPALAIVIAGAFVPSHGQASTRVGVGLSFGVPLVFPWGYPAYPFYPNALPRYPYGVPPRMPAPAFYGWPIGIETGSCDRAYISRAIGGARAGAMPVQAADGLPIGGVWVMPLVGGKLGGRMDIVDQSCLVQSLELARTGSTIAWKGAYNVPFRATVAETYYRPDGTPCRTFRVTAQIGRAIEATGGGACRNDDGGWQASG